MKKKLLEHTHLCQWTREVITIVVHEMVSVAAKLIADFFDYSAHFFFVEVRTSNLYTLSIVGKAMWYW